MRLTDCGWWRHVGLGVGLVLMGGCSDDGLPADGGEGGGTEEAGAGTDPSGITTTITTGATASGGSDSDPGGTSGGTTASGTATADPTDADGTSGPDDSTGEPGDSTGDSETSGGGPPPECEVAEDCVLHDNCCDCMALPAGEQPPACDIEACFISACTSQGLAPQVQCEVDSCTFVPVACNPFDVQCDEDAPPCADGTLASIDPLTGCWTGACVPAQHCDAVPSCEFCPADEVCVRRVSQIPAYTCSPVAAACDGAATCDCMGDAVCVGMFDACSEDEDGLACGCPQC